MGCDAGEVTALQPAAALLVDAGVDKIIVTFAAAAAFYSLFKSGAGKGRLQPTLLAVLLLQVIELVDLDACG